jgi:endonuclease YncB( thermonuclease family)
MIDHPRCLLWKRGWCGVVFALAWCFASGAAANDTCAPLDGGSYDVQRVIDGETLLLEGGTEVRLIGALAWGSDTEASRDGAQAQTGTRALESLVRERSVRLRYDGRQRDRYGRALAQVYVGAKEAGGEIWLQERLIRDGHARSYALLNNSGCFKFLLAAEAEARAEKRGLWGVDKYRVRSANDVEALLRLTGQFVIVEGRVASTARTQKTTYINFGADWRGDFTASVANTAVDRASNGAPMISSLTGKLVRVRGWIERRNGPMVTLVSIDEIEVPENGKAN